MYKFQDSDQLTNFPKIRFDYYVSYELGRCPIFINGGRAAFSWPPLCLSVRRIELALILAKRQRFLISLASHREYSPALPRFRSLTGSLNVSWRRRAARKLATNEIIILTRAEQREIDKVTKLSYTRSYTHTCARACSHTHTSTYLFYTYVCVNEISLVIATATRKERHAETR